MTPLHKRFIALTLIVLASAPTLNASDAAPVVDLGYVKYKGQANSTIGINYFRGIHYAASPVDSLRWRQPVPIELKNSFNSNQIIDASTPGPYCPQSLPVELASTLSFPSYNGSEDCLLLDVLVPQSPVSKSLPILLNIHGGGFALGGAELDPGDALVHASNGSLIYVSIQYRLGLYGFLAGSEVKENGNLNTGLLDQRAALEWTQRNIAKFGGDPSKVTILGGSAGGSSVTYQLTAGGGIGNPPFSAAIAEYPWWQPLMNDSSQNRQYQKVLDYAGCGDLNCLRSLSTAELNDAQAKSNNDTFESPGYGYGLFNWGPVVDGEFVRDLPDQSFKKDGFYKVPLMVDRDAYEGVIFSNKTATTQAETYLDAQSLFPYNGQSFFSRLFDLYPASDFNSTFYQRQTWFGDFIINCPTYQIASAMVDRSWNSSAVFKLTFAAGSELHGATGNFLFSDTIGWPGANNATLAKYLSSYFISFAITHDPNPLKAEGAVDFPSYIGGGNSTAFEGEGVNFKTLGITYTGMEAVKDPDVSARCDFFSSQGWVLRN